MHCCELVSNIKKIADITLLNPKKLDMMKISKCYGIQHNTICIPFESDGYWLKVIQIVRQKSESWKMRLSDKLIDNELIRFIYQFKTDKQKCDIGKSVEMWLEYLKELPVTNFRFILPVNDIEYREDMDFGKVRLIKLDMVKLKKLAPCPDKHNCFNDEILNDLTSDNKTDVFAIVDVQAKSEVQGMDFANSNLKRMIHTIRLFDPESLIIERKHYFPETNFIYMVIDQDNNISSKSYSKIHSKSYIKKPDDYWEQVAPSLNIIKKFLFSENPNKMQDAIINALYWYGSADKEEDELFQFLKYVIGLEHLVIFDNEFKKNEPMSERIAIIFRENDYKHHAERKKLLREYYKIRNNIIHSKKIIVEKEVVDISRMLLRNLILKYIKLSEKYTDVKTMLKKEYSITINNGK